MQNRPLSVAPFGLIFFGDRKIKSPKESYYFSLSGPFFGEIGGSRLPPTLRCVRHRDRLSFARRWRALAQLPVAHCPAVGWLQRDLLSHSAAGPFSVLVRHANTFRARRALFHVLSIAAFQTPMLRRVCGRSEIAQLNFQYVFLECVYFVHFRV